VATWAERPNRALKIPKGRTKLEENSFQNKNRIFEYTKALKVCTTRFRTNFDVGIFPKFI
jgi:hypothetical protein